MYAESPTRGAAILDKIYTNILDWYEKPVILPNIGQSDHNAVLMQATSGIRPTDSGNVVTISVRSQDPNGKALLAQAISEVDWTSLYSMDTCDEMVTQFYNTVITSHFGTRSNDSPNSCAESSTLVRWRVCATAILG